MRITTSAIPGIKTILGIHKERHPGQVTIKAKQFQVNVEVASLKGRRGYFQVCRDFEETDRGIQMGYRDCLIRGSLEDGSFDSMLEVPNHFNELAVEARSYDANENPYRYIWRRAVDGDIIILKL